ncbi:hypothetical protein GCM10027341_36600 [Spirosoma knui]
MVKDNTNQEEPEHLVFGKQKGHEIKIELLYLVNEQDPVKGVNCRVTSNGFIEKADIKTQGTGSFLHFDPQKMKEKIGPAVIYKPDPNKLAQPSLVGEGADIVNADASNLVAFLDYVLSEHR